MQTLKREEVRNNRKNWILRTVCAAGRPQVTDGKSRADQYQGGSAEGCAHRSPRQSAA